MKVISAIELAGNSACAGGALVRASGMRNETVVNAWEPSATVGPAPMTLFAEANHRIANHLALLAGMLRLQAHALPDAPTMPTGEVADILGEVGLRIETIGRLHGLLASAPVAGDVELASYLGEVARIAVASFDERAELTLSLAPGCLLSQKDTAAVGLIVGEAITNSLKYAHPTSIKGAIEVGCRQHRDGGIVLEIADDGVGLPVDFDPEASDALGLRLIRSLALQLSARLEFEQPGIGLCVRLIIPCAEASADLPA